MLEIDIPGQDLLRLHHLVCDYNGTLACDGRLLPDLHSLILEISSHLQVHVITADTFGIAQQGLSDLPVTLAILQPGQQDKQKAAYIRELGAQSCVCLGNGRNDALMLQHAALGICLVQAEGASAVTVGSADVVCRSAHDALNLLLNPKRLVATLRV